LLPEEEVYSPLSELMPPDSPIPKSAPTQLHWHGFAALAAFIVFVSIQISWVRWNPAPEMHPIRGQISLGWLDTFPYQMSLHDKGLIQRDGLSLKIIDRCLDGMGYVPDFRDLQWRDQISALQEGRLTAMPMSCKTADREAFAYFSEPYLQLKFGAFSRSGLEAQWNLESLQKWARSKGLRICATEGFAYPRPIQEMIDDARREKRLVEVTNEAESLDLLAQQNIDLAFLDELVGFSFIKHNRWESVIDYHALDLPVMDLCLMFSKTSASPELVEEFNRSLRELRENGHYARLIRSYYYPRLLYGVTNSWYFRAMTISAAMFAGLSGLLLAHREGYDLIGALLLAGCPAVGGGILRDLVAGRSPLTVVADPVNLVAIAILVGIGWIFFRVAPLRWRQGIEALDPGQDRRVIIFDTLGMAAYTIVAVFTAMQANCEPLWLWGPLLAVAQNGGGSIMRDLLAGRGGQIAILKGTIYGEIAAFWALLLSVFLLFQSANLEVGMGHIGFALVATAMGVIATRALILRRRWTSPPY
jgi:polar amino acid transport system substrate-binding protein